MKIFGEMAKKLKILIFSDNKDLNSRLYARLTEWGYNNLTFSEDVNEDMVIKTDPDAFIFYTTPTNHFLIYDLVCSFPIIRKRSFLIFCSEVDYDDIGRKYHQFLKMGFSGLYLIERPLTQLNSSLEAILSSHN